MWIYLTCSTDSRSSPELEALMSPCEIGLDQSPIANSTPIVKQSSCLVWRTEALTMLRSGTMLLRSGVLGYRRLTSFTAASLDHARISVLQELKKTWILSEVDCFSISRDWLTKLNHSLFSSKTFPMSSKSVEIQSLKNLSRWGWTAVGRAFLPQVVEHRIKEIDGFYWPTPTASQAGKPNGYDLQDKLGKHMPHLIGMKVNVLFLEWIMGFPLNWTELNHLETQLYPCKLEKLFTSC